MLAWRSKGPWLSPSFWQLFLTIWASLVAQMVESACSVGDLDSIPGSGRSPGEGNDNPPQYSCLQNPMDGWAQQATVHGVTKSRTRLSEFTFYFLAMHMDFFFFTYTHIIKVIQRGEDFSQKTEWVQVLLTLVIQFKSLHLRSFSPAKFEFINSMELE